ncbi:N-acetylmuramic acid 6-phosphate etherase [Microbacterium sp. ARD32]|uniref:N-acetylmuramic acid 6-phosphate etherase n=1 Tax=Microbacterium sp. ARD32 TaxID=2962577 RepID=UPI002881D441|nr:N-acetylmuramic acid 6-phosphate etherase [Microbacterium sp. ARD32]MDT0158633.1 N-acetylmuramic acid 6-phosphate etherase [Microbacterium sp. ARD32]
MTDRAELRSTLETFATERVDPRFAELDTLDTRAQVRLMAEHGHRAVDAVAEAEKSIARAVDGIVERMRRGGRLIYIGAGSPGRLGVLDASEVPPTFGADPGLVVGVIAGGDTALRSAVEGAEDDAAAGAAAIVELETGPLDSVVGISASGRTPYVIGALQTARERGALAISLAGNRSAQMSADADIAIEAEAAPEIVAGSTRLNSGTAQKLVLNMLSTLAMVQLGKVYGNLMVDVRSTNEKLRARAERIVISATGCSPDEATRALAAADGSVKLAVGIVSSGADPAAVREALAAADGHLRVALAALASRSAADPAD